MAIWHQHHARRNPLVSQLLLQNLPDTFPFSPHRDVLDLPNFRRVIRQLLCLNSRLESNGDPLATRTFLRRGRRRSFFLERLDPVTYFNSSNSKLWLATSTTSLSCILLKSTHPKQVFISDDVPRRPVRQSSLRILVKTSTPSGKSMRAGVLNSESAKSRSDNWSNLRSGGIGCRGRSFVIFFSTYASTPIISAASLTTETWNRTEAHVGILVPPIPSTIIFFLLRGRRRCWAIRSCTNEVEDPGSIRALTIEGFHMTS